LKSIGIPDFFRAPPQCRERAHAQPAPPKRSRTIGTKTPAISVMEKERLRLGYLNAIHKPASAIHERNAHERGEYLNGFDLSAWSLRDAFAEPLSGNERRLLVDLAHP
jgi:hypothetical protein